MTGSRVLFISPLDRNVVPNTREQNLADACREAGHSTLTLTLAQNTSRRLWDIVKDTVTSKTRASPDGYVVCIDPPLNPCTGLHTNLEPVHSDTAATEHVDLRRRMVRFIAPMGVLRDVVIVPVFVLHALSRGRFDICIAFGPWAACVGWVLKKLGRIDILIYDDQDYEPAIMRNAMRQRWAIFLERTMMQRADVVVSVGARLGALRELQTGRQVAVIPNGVRSKVLPADRSQAAAASSPGLTLVYVGNVVPWSGLDTMLAGLPGVIARHSGVRVIIVGDGLPVYVEGLRRQVLDLGLQQSVQFVGRVPNSDIGFWLGQADVGLAHFRPEPYRRYAFPLKVVEYMQAGLAVIGTQETETEDILRLHDMGIAVPFLADAIADAILQLAHDPALLSRYQRNARSAVAHYQWPALAARELALAADVVALKAALKGAR